VNTGSLITSIVNGHWKESKTQEATPPAPAGSARDMLSPGDGFKWAQRNLVVGKRVNATVPANEVIYPTHLED
jgi:hypothetical protein